MHTWREFAALGHWGRIKVSQIETEIDRSDLRWALSEILPRETSKVGFQDRDFMPQEVPVLLKQIKRGDYEKAMRRVREKLAPDAPLDSIKEVPKCPEAARALERYVKQGYLPEGSSAETAWQLEQLELAYLAFRELKASEVDIAPPSDEWLRRSVEVARSVFNESTLSSTDIFDKVSPTFASLEQIFVKPTQPTSSSIINEAKLKWSVKQLANPDDIALHPPEEGDEPVFGSRAGKAAKKKHAEEERRLIMDGWYRLSALADPDHEHFEFALGHAVSIIRWAEEAETMLRLIKGPGKYRASKSAVVDHMHELAEIAFEIGRHVESLRTTKFVPLARLAEKQKNELAARNPNPKGSTKDETLEVYEFMKKHINEQVQNGKKPNVSEAARAATKKWPDRKEEANRRFYYDKENKSIDE